MITIEKCNTGAFTPANDAEANGEIIGRCNALHDWLMKEAKDRYFTSDNKMVCTLMGFADVIRYHEEYVAEMEKASGANAD